MLTLHDEASVRINAPPEELFNYLDDHRNLSAHMSSSSWMMAGSRMTIETDDEHGRAVGSRISLRGRVMGIDLSVDEAVTERAPPYRKSWKTFGEPKLLVIGAYQMGFEITPERQGSGLRVFIDYELPFAPSLRWFRHQLAAWYARWCTRRMAVDAARHFTSTEDHKMSTTISSHSTAPSQIETANRFHGIDSRSLGLSAALAAGVAFTLCSLIVIAVPGTAERFVSYAFHLDITGLTRAITPASFVVGLVFLMLYVGALLSATAAIYNRMIIDRSQRSA
jgi:hypothetical protein